MTKETINISSTSPSDGHDSDEKDQLEEKTSPYAALTSSLHTFHPTAPRHSRNSSSVNGTLAATYLSSLQPPPNKPNAVNNLLAYFGIRAKNEKTSKLNDCGLRQKATILSMFNLFTSIFLVNKFVILNFNFNHYTI